MNVHALTQEETIDVLYESHTPYENVKWKDYITSLKPTPQMHVISLYAVKNL